MYFWGVFYTHIYGNSAEKILQISYFICIQAITYTTLEKTLDYYANYIANIQASITRNSIIQKMGSNISSLGTFDAIGQKISEPNSFFNQLNQTIKQCLVSVANLIGNAIFLIQYGLLQTSSKFIALMIVSEYLIYKSTTTNHSYSLSKLVQKHDNAAGTLREKVEKIEEKKDFYSGQKNLLSWYLKLIEKEYSKLYTLTYTPKLLAEKCIEGFTGILLRLTQALACILVVTHVGLKFPLAENLHNNRLIEAGIFTQILVCFQQIWRSGSIFQNNYKKVAQVHSSFNNMRDFHVHLNYSTKDIKPTVIHINKTTLFFKNIWMLFTLWSFTTAVAALLRSFELLTLPSTVLSPIPLTHFILIQLTSILTALRYDNSDNDITILSFSLASIFALATLITGIYLPVANSFFTNPFSLQMACQISAVIGSLTGIILGLRYNTYQKEVSNGTPPSPGATETSTTFIHTKQHNNSNKIVLKDLALYANKNKILSFSDGTTLDFDYGKSHLVQGLNGTGKSSLLVRSLSTYDSKKQKDGSWVQGSVYSHGDIELTFSQNGNPMQDLSLYTENFTLRSNKEPTSLTDLKKIFFSFSIQNPDKPNEKDEDIIKNWPYYHNLIHTFLADPILSFDPGNHHKWLDKIKSEEVDFGMSGGSKSKLISAVIYALLHITKKSPNRKVLITIDEGFDGIHDVAKNHIIKKIAGSTRSLPNSTLICVLHGVTSEVKKEFSTIVTLKSSPDQETKGCKVTPHMSFNN